MTFFQIPHASRDSFRNTIKSLKAIGYKGAFGNDYPLNPVIRVNTGAIPLTMSSGTSIVPGNGTEISLDRFLAAHHPGALSAAGIAAAPTTEAARAARGLSVQIVTESEPEHTGATAFLTHLGYTNPLGYEFPVIVVDLANKRLSGNYILNSAHGPSVDLTDFIRTYHNKPLVQEPKPEPAKPEPPKMVELRLNANHIAQITKAGVTVGDMSFTHEKILELAAAVEAAASR